MRSKTFYYVECFKVSLIMYSEVSPSLLCAWALRVMPIEEKPTEFSPESSWGFLDI
jgi:hypothetical protein